MGGHCWFGEGVWEGCRWLRYEVCAVYGVVVVVWLGGRFWVGGVVGLAEFREVGWGVSTGCGSLCMPLFDKAAFALVLALHDMIH